MNTVVVSQRVDVWADRGERRDALDQQLVAFLAACGARAVPIPNVAAAMPGGVDGWLDALAAPAGIVLSGGNDLVEYDGTVPERDATERALYRAAVDRGLPVVGICRGFQMLVVIDGGRLAPLDGHVGGRHPISDGRQTTVVNSFHRLGITTLPAGWTSLATSPDGAIEAARRPDRRTLGLMWHPERDVPFASRDLHLVRDALSLGARP